MNTLNIVVAQINVIVGDIKGNAQRIIDTTKRAVKEQNADLVVFPELALTGYPPEDLLVRPGFYRRCEVALNALKNEIKGTSIIIGYPEKKDGKYYNSACVIQNTRIIAHYIKQCLPNYDVFDEKRYFSAGNEPCIFNLKGIDIGLVICEDLWHTGPAAQSVAAGAELIVSINASPYDRNKVRARQTMLEERIAETHVPIIYGNLVGGQDELVFDGGSMVVNSIGERCLQASYFKEDLMLVKVEKKDNVLIQPETLPARMTEEETLYNALVLGVGDYIRKNNFPGAILGLSGGIDSALTLAILGDAIGSENVMAVMMPSRYTRDMSLEDAQQQANTQGAPYHVIEIGSMYKDFLENLTPLFKDKPVDTTEENLQARIRGTLLMALSNKFGSLVIATGNKSEFSVGYSTLYGDMVGGFAALKDLPKTWVYRLANYRNSVSPVIPQRVIDRPPSAELAEDQIDQDSLPAYPILDEILHRYIELDEDPIDMYSKQLPEDVVNHVVKLVNRNEYKRRQAPVGIRTTPRAFGKDRRYPITSGYWKNI